MADNSWGLESQGRTGPGVSGPRWDAAMVGTSSRCHCKHMGPPAVRAGA